MLRAPPTSPLRVWCLCTPGMDGVQAVPRESPDHSLCFHGSSEAVASQAAQQRGSGPLGSQNQALLPLEGSLWPGFLCIWPSVGRLQRVASG